MPRLPAATDTPGWLLLPEYGQAPRLPNTVLSGCVASQPLACRQGPPDPPSPAFLSPSCSPRVLLGLSPQPPVGVLEASGDVTMKPPCAGQLHALLLPRLLGFVFTGTLARFSLVMLVSRVTSPLLSESARERCLVCTPAPCRCF